MRLKKEFYRQPTLKLSQQLLGKFLVRKIGRKKIVGKIVETESYIGPNDLASHASRGKTPRTQIMFGDGGFWYIYLGYGMYYCLNIVTEHKNYPAAVLIRAVEPVAGLKSDTKTKGPGKVCRAFKIDKNLNGTRAFGNKARLWIEDRGIKLKPNQIKKTTRIGVDYAGEYKNKLWRFYIKDNPFVSQK